tara:strand:+ start:345 stop:509 length:165 start_codon:yes stop_codon:yes gene_type:complete
MYKTVSGQKIYKPEQYAKTGKPMIDKKGKNINKKTSINNGLFKYIIVSITTITY